MTLSSLTAWHSVILIKTQIFPVAKIFFSIHFPFALWFLFFTVHIHPHSDLHFVSGPKRAKWLVHSPCPRTSRLFGPMPFVLHEPWWNISSSFRVLFSSDVALELGQSPAHQQNGDTASPSSWSSDLVTFFLMPCCFSRLEGAYSHLEWILLVSQWCSDNFKHSLKQFFFSFFSWSPAGTFSGVFLSCYLEHDLKEKPPLPSERKKWPAGPCLLGCP